MGIGIMFRKWRGGSDFCGRFRKRVWKIWIFGYSFCEGVGSVFGEDDIFEIIIRVIKCLVGVSGILV